MIFSVHLSVGDNIYSNDKIASRVIGCRLVVA